MATSLTGSVPPRSWLHLIRNTPATMMAAPAIRSRMFCSNHRAPYATPNRRLTRLMAIVGRLDLRDGHHVADVLDGADEAEHDHGPRPAEGARGLPVVPGHGQSATMTTVSTRL